MDEKNYQNGVFSVIACVEPVRAYVEATQVQHYLEFDKFIELITKFTMTASSARKSLALSCLHDSNVLRSLIVEV